MKYSICAILIFFLAGCSTLPPPKDTKNVCKIFKQRKKWYWAARDAEKRWGTPINVQMAIMKQESGFNAKARPGRKKLLWIIPWKRKSSAYGYNQALKGTWNLYRKAVGKRVDRDNFKDAIDFISWYGAKARKRLGLNKNDAYSLYLAYHEGMGGYKRKTYLRKKWLLNVAKKVQRHSTMYKRQLYSCRRSLKRKPWYRFW